MSRVSLVEDIEERRLDSGEIPRRTHSGLTSYKSRATLAKTSPAGARLTRASEYAFRVVMPGKLRIKDFERRMDAVRFAERYVANLPSHSTIHVLDCRASKIIATLRGCVPPKPRKKVRPRVLKGSRKST
jgi:hypothetical protein